MSKIINFISLNKRYIYTNILMLYLLYILLKSNWSDKFNKKPSCYNTKVKKQQNDFIDLENHVNDITESIENEDSSNFYNVNYDRQLELVVKFILFCFILIIVVLANST